MKTATYIRTLTGWRSDARLYRLSERVTGEERREAPAGGSEYRPVQVDHVIVSAVVDVASGPETYIFPANNEGEALSMLEMEGSFRGSLDHVAALAGLGFDTNGSDNRDQEGV